MSIEPQPTVQIEPCRVTLTFSPETTAKLAALLEQALIHLTLPAEDEALCEALAAACRAATIASLSQQELDWPALVDVRAYLHELTLTR